MAERWPDTHSMLDLSSFKLSVNPNTVDAESLKSLNNVVGVYNAIPNYKGKFCYRMDKSGPQTRNLFLFWSADEGSQGWWVCTEINGKDYYALSPLGLAG